MGYTMVSCQLIHFGATNQVNFYRLLHYFSFLLISIIFVRKYLEDFSYLGHHQIFILGAIVLYQVWVSTFQKPTITVIPIMEVI